MITNRQPHNYNCTCIIYKVINQYTTLFLVLYLASLQIIVIYIHIYKSLHIEINLYLKNKHPSLLTCLPDFSYWLPVLEQSCGVELLIHKISAKKIDFRTLVLDYFIDEDLITEEQLSDNCYMPIYLLLCSLLMRMQSLENALVIM